ncbi:hypothetical protein F53441_7140 [Fusarium austroafricanum]|uniref:BTB domain-containing protein n=1 Tax=Fusarium austroafricanum TaxID=2364996 RepID=A0A8H4KH49_9HYPO|nr:hypothetical protein F53441_7140 [Fusarium austroafricanum]
MSTLGTPASRPILLLYFRDKGPYALPRVLLAQCPKLARFFADLDGSHFEDLDESTGLALINFLYTGEYAPVHRFYGTAQARCEIQMYKTAFNSYALGDNLDLPAFQAQAGEQLDRLLSVMRPHSVMEAVLDSGFAADCLGGRAAILPIWTEHVLEKATYREARRYLLECKVPTTFGQICVVMVLMTKARGDSLLRARLMLLEVLPTQLPRDMMNEVEASIRQAIYRESLEGPRIVPVYQVPKLRPRALPKLKRGKIARAQIGLVKRAGTRNKAKRGGHIQVLVFSTISII